MQKLHAYDRDVLCTISTNAPLTDEGRSERRPSSAVYAYNCAPKHKTNYEKKSSILTMGWQQKALDT